VRGAEKLTGFLGALAYFAYFYVRYAERIARGGGLARVAHAHRIVWAG
jgi:hypothetical protein